MTTGDRNYQQFTRDWDAAVARLANECIETGAHAGAVENRIGPPEGSRCERHWEAICNAGTVTECATARRDMARQSNIDAKLDRTGERFYADDFMCICGKCR